MPKGQRLPAATWNAIEAAWNSLEPVVAIALRHGINVWTVYHHAEKHGWMPRVRAGGSLVGPHTPRVRARRGWRPGDRLCRSCYARTPTDPCNVCNGISDPVRRSA